jgi:DNA-binding response OmpR family regulator
MKSTNTSLGGYLWKASILLLDTDSDFVLLVEQYLRMEGYFTQRITTINDAKSFVPLSAPNIILCSVALAPFLDEVIKKIRELHTEVVPKVVILSNHGTIEDTRYAMKLGADDCIPKLVSPEFIVLVIESILNRKR